MTKDTIFDLSCGSGRACLSVFRISGSMAFQVLKTLTGITKPKARYAYRVELKDNIDKETIDDGIAIFFPNPKSFTGEDVLEFHLHGSIAVIREVTEVLSGFIGVRIANAGEFTKRAFDNRKLDLTMVEGLADLVNAETKEQKRQAQKQLRGEFSELCTGWKETLVKAITLYEAGIDYADEDLPKNLIDGVRGEIDKLEEELEKHLIQSEKSSYLRDGFQVAILGPPNSGKSSILNCLSKREVSIVSRTAGTTRDVVEARLDLGGFPITIADTAGLRDSEDLIEKEGISRAIQRAEDAEMRIAVFDGENWPELDKKTLDLLETKNTLAVVNKTDLGFDIKKGNKGLIDLIGVSAKLGNGIDELEDKILKEVSQRAGIYTGPVLTRERHVASLRDCLSCLKRYKEASELELAAEDLRLAMRELGAITGHIGVEEVLGNIFGEFCIGK